jgi:NADPH:quinone reductase-like Zn-dependent oxidoreductase
MQDARDLGVATVVAFDYIPPTLKGQFDIVFDTVGTLTPATARMLLKSGGHIVDIVPTAGKFVRSVLPGPYNVVIAQHNAEDLNELARACAGGTLRLPIAQVVPLTDAIAALTELERNNKPRGGKLIITAN